MFNIVYLYLSDMYQLENCYKCSMYVTLGGASRARARGAWPDPGLQGEVAWLRALRGQATIRTAGDQTSQTHQEACVTPATSATETQVPTTCTDSAQPREARKAEVLHKSEEPITLGG